MKNTKIFTISIAILLWASQSFAGPKTFMTSESSKSTFRQDETNLTPRDRIRLSEQKVKESPSLRRRWNRRSHEPASETSMSGDNLSQKVLSRFQDDEELSKLPVKMKVSSSKGTVTLNGVVNDAGERDLIEEKVGEMEGVKKVVNRLKVKTSDHDLLD